MFKDLANESSVSIIYITHDIALLSELSQRIAVMYAGEVVELGTTERIVYSPMHPYTEALLSAVPIPDPDAEQTEIRLNGNVPSALNPPSGCVFHTRCPRRNMLPEDGKICETERPPWRDSARGHRILCHIPLEELAKVDPVVKVKKAAS